MIFLLTVFMFTCFFLFIAGMVWAVGVTVSLVKWGLIAVLVFVIGKVIYDAFF